MKIPFLNLHPTHSKLKQEILAAFEEVYDSNWFIAGSKLAQFESEYARFNNVTNCIGVSNGLDALFLALKALNVGPGDEVIVPSNTYIATALAVTHTGATPVFVEPVVSSYNIDPDLIASAISIKTKAIIPVHLYGQACQMDAICSITEKHGLHIVEDNAQAHGARFAGKATGSWGAINATSFYPGKNLGALGDGGALTTNSEALAASLSMLRNYGSKEKYVHEIDGYNMRLDECQAAFLSVKLKYLTDWTQQRQMIAAMYDEGLSGTGDLILPQVHPGATHVYHLYVIRTNHRSNLSVYLAERGIGTLIHYPQPPHLQKAYREMGYHKGDFPIAELIADTCLSLPLWPGMAMDDIAFIINTIKRFFDE